MRAEDQQQAWREIAQSQSKSMSAADVLWSLVWTVVLITGLGVFITIFGPLGTR